MNRRAKKQPTTERLSPRKVLKIDMLLSALQLDGGVARAIDAVGEEVSVVVAALKSGEDVALLNLENLLDRLEVRIACIADLARADELVVGERRRELLEAGGFPNLRIALAYAQNTTTMRYSPQVVLEARRKATRDLDSPAAWTRVLDELAAREPAVARPPPMPR